MVKWAFRESPDGVSLNVRAILCYSGMLVKITPGTITRLPTTVYEPEVLTVLRMLEAHPGSRCRLTPDLGAVEFYAPSEER